MFILDLQTYRSQVMQKLTCSFVFYVISFHKCHKGRKNTKNLISFIMTGYPLLNRQPDSISNFKYYESFESEEDVHDLLITDSRVTFPTAIC